MTGPIGWLRSLVGSEIPSADSATVTASPVPMVDSATVRRALSVVGQGRYRLGRGGRKPAALAPFDRDGLADCSGYASWCLGLDRYQPGAIDGDWISTDSIYRDATGPHRMFRDVPVGGGGQWAMPGDLVVYPGRHVGGVRVAIGHVGVVVEPGPTIATCRVAHCAASGKVAVRVSDGRPWARSGIVARRV